MSETLPLFPLGAVLFPGLLLPLHIFEERYRQLVRDLQAGPEPRRFGVVAIRQGRETGVDGIQALYEIGCTATVRQVKELEDGRYDIVTVGTDRFRLTGLDESKPYLRRGWSGTRSARTWARSPSAASPRSAPRNCRTTRSRCPTWSARR